MKKKELSFSLVEVVVIVLISVLFGGVIGGIATSGKKEYLDENLSEFNKTYNDIINNYYKKVDKKELSNAAIKGMVNYLGDPYSVYMNSEQAEDFNTTVNGRYKGIGVTLSMVEEKPTIISIFKDSPADKAKLKENDVITKVNSKSVKNKSLDDIIKLIKKNDKVKLTIMRDEKEKDYDLVLSNVDIPSVTSDIIEKNDKKIGYISISVFAANVYKQFSDELNKLEDKKIDSLIIDVRDNPGGHLTQVTNILSLFMDKKAVIYQIKDNGKKTKYYANNDANRKYKVVVLINENSASASEILAGAFKESYKNREIVGVKSYGKGTVQEEFSLESGASIKYTTEEWLTPNGNSINKKGIEPTIEEELNQEFKDDPKKENDNQLNKAIEILSE